MTAMTGPAAVAFTVDPWDPGYGLAFSADTGGGALEESTAELDLNLEMPAARWHPVDPDPVPRLPWSGIVRLECSADLPRAEVVRLADLTARLLPPLASVPHKDPRAPQNLVPIGGLERELRHRLGPRYLSSGLWCGPVNGKSIQRIAERIYRRLNEVVSNRLYCLGLGGAHQRAGYLRDMIRFIEGDMLSLGIQHCGCKLRPDERAAAESRVSPAVLRVYRS